LRIVGEGLQRVAKSRSPWQVEIDPHLVQPIAFEWPLHKAQPSVASQDNEWQVSAAAVRVAKPDHLQSTSNGDQVG
jgi:hypothetical protein